jgi:NADH oxidoreductase Hcr
MSHPTQPHPHWQGECPLTCTARNSETHDSVTFTFGAADRRFHYLPGQFISLGVEIAGKTHWRAYSLSSSPRDSRSLSITVKRVTAGLVSNWLIDHLQPGNTVPALAPAGEFCLKPENIPARLALFSAGSGITPLMSMVRWLLASEHPAEIDFFHSARQRSDVIFGAQLEQLSLRHARFHLHLFLSAAAEHDPAHHGRLDATRLQALLSATDHTQAWICGQQNYMDAVSSWLSAAGMPPEHIYRESFTPLPASNTPHGASYQVEIAAFGKTVQLSAGETLLEGLEREGLPIIGACRSGVCGSCKCQVQQGEVVSSSSLPLTEDERARGVVLACSSHATSDLKIVL